MKTLLIFLLSFSALTVFSQNKQDLPVPLPGNFMDDYGIKYQISDTLFFMLSATKYHVLRWNTKEQYIIAHNGLDNPHDKGLYTRIDYMKFENMEPYKWGFCLTTWDAKTDSLAEFTALKVDRANPRKGCSGFPFSRLKRID